MKNLNTVLSSLLSNTICEISLLNFLKLLFEINCPDINLSDHTRRVGILGMYLWDDDT